MQTAFIVELTLSGRAQLVYPTKCLIKTDIPPIFTEYPCCRCCELFYSIKEKRTV